MFLNTPVFSSFSAHDLGQAKTFYAETLGLKIEETAEGLSLHLNGGGKVFIYPKENHSAASFTVLNFLVEDIDETVAALSKQGVVLEHFEGELQTDAQGIFRGKSKGQGPDIAWFKDPSGNFLSVIEE